MGGAAFKSHAKCKVGNSKHWKIRGIQCVGRNSGDSMQNQSDDDEQDQTGGQGTEPNPDKLFVF